MGSAKACNTRSITPVYRQWQEELPPALIAKALATGDLTLLQEAVYLVERR